MTGITRSCRGSDHAGDKMLISLIDGKLTAEITYSDGAKLLLDKTGELEEDPFDWDRFARFMGFRPAHLSEIAAEQPVNLVRTSGLRKTWETPLDILSSAVLH